MYRLIPQYEDFYALKLVENYWDTLDSRTKAEATVARFLGVPQSMIHIMFAERRKLLPTEDSYFS